MSIILEAREKRARHIEALMQEFKYKTIIILKTNVPGADKNPRKLKFICKYSDILYNRKKGQGRNLVPYNIDIYP